MTRIYYRNSVAQTTRARPLSGKLYLASLSLSLIIILLYSWSAIVVLLHCWETFLMSSTETYWTLFSWWLNWKNLCLGSKNVSTFFVSEQQNLFVSCMAKLGNICLCNNVSVTSFPSLARPLWLLNQAQCAVFLQITVSSNFSS